MKCLNAIETAKFVTREPILNSDKSNVVRVTIIALRFQVHTQ